MDLDKLLARRLPDPLLRSAVRLILRRKTKLQEIDDIEERQAYITSFVESLEKEKIAVHTDNANEQHYELPPQFFKAVLGKMLKYSCGYWTSFPELSSASEYLDQSEEDMLALTCKRAGVEEGQHILDLGCGWGSAALYMAREYPGAQITAVSNSTPQIEYINSEAEKLGYKNLRAMKADINDLELPQNFDRVVTVEMFEHMRNYKALLQKVSGFIKPAGKLFVHIFSHHTYPFFKETYGEDEAEKWWNYWRLFFLSCAEFFGFRDGNEWFVSHYLLSKK